MTPRICITHGCGKAIYGPWMSPHPEAGLCLTCGVARWLKRFRKRNSAIAQEAHGDFLGDPEIARELERLAEAAGEKP